MIYLKFLREETSVIHKLCLQREYSKAILKDCPKPCLPMNILITGANSEVGQITAFFLKQNASVKKVTLYDKRSSASIVEELKTIPTSSEVKCFTGRKNLPEAIKDARIIVICGGHQKYSEDSEHDLFRANAEYVREIVMYCTEFNPHAHICISTPPVSCLVPLTIEEGKKGNVLFGKRVYGIVTQNLIRAKSLAGQELKVSPENLNISLIGGEHRRLCIPVLSQMKPRKLTPLREEMLTRSIQDAEINLLRLKDSDHKPKNKCCYFTIACATAKFVISLIKALDGGENIYECAYVKQDQPLEKYCSYLTTVVKLSKDGIAESKVPKLSDTEKMRLKHGLDEIKDNIHIGESFITGNDKPVYRKKVDKSSEESYCIVRKPKKRFNWEKCPHESNL